MAAMNARVGPGRQAVGSSRPVSPYWQLFIRFWWVAILVLLIVLAIEGGRATSPAGVSTSNRAAMSSPIATRTTRVGAAAPVATPSVRDNSAWYLYQETHEGDYCQCNK